jgi:hypothetical protein
MLKQKVLPQCDRNTALSINPSQLYTRNYFYLNTIPLLVLKCGKYNLLKKKMRRFRIFFLSRAGLNLSEALCFNPVWPGLKGHSLQGP